MNQVEFKTAAATNRWAMEADTISKNGRSSKSQMSRWKIFSFLLIVFFSFGCIKEEFHDTVKLEKTDLPISFISEGETKNYQKESDIVFTVESIPEWITVVKTGNTGEQIFQLTASKNETNESRTGDFVIKGEETTKETTKKGLKKQTMNTTIVYSFHIPVTQFGQ